MRLVMSSCMRRALRGSRHSGLRCFCWSASSKSSLLRGYAQFTLARGIGFWPAALVLSCGFGLIHLRNDGEQWRGLLAAAFIGFFFCLTLRRTGNLWFAVGFHAAWDWGETFFYSVPDSGMVAPGHLLSSSLARLRMAEWRISRARRQRALLRRDCHRVDCV